MTNDAEKLDKALRHIAWLDAERAKTNDVLEKTARKTHQDFWDRSALAALHGRSPSTTARPSDLASWAAKCADLLVAQRRDRFEK